MTVTGQLSVWVFCENIKRNQRRNDNVNSNCYICNNLQPIHNEDLLCARYYAKYFICILKI